MGLEITVGALAGLQPSDPAGAGALADALEVANDLLIAAGLPPHDEPDGELPLDNRAGSSSFPHPFLHHLRRSASRWWADPRWEWAPSNRPADDPVFKELVATKEWHLLSHSDREGLYLPIDFDVLLEDPGVPGGTIGSSYRLLRELVSLAPHLGIAMDGEIVPDDVAAEINADPDERPMQVERLVWLALYEACRLSIQNTSAIVFL
jgi:hypothetical protein